MTILTGIRDASYLVQFLGRKIAVKRPIKENSYLIFPRLFSICVNGTALVEDSEGKLFLYGWESLENPHILIEEDVEIEMM